jgi:DNA-binding response OmpR family regulator
MSKKKILLVDDDVTTRLVLSAKLRAANYDTVVAADSMQAITVARKESPDLAILDIEMPGGDGFVVVQRFRAITALALIPIIIMSSSVEREKAEARSLEAGAEAFLTKPVNHDELLATIEMVLGE